jgi:hypothetical protein
MSHQVGASGGGSVWPDLTFSTDGSVIWVRARRTSSNAFQPIRYLSNFDIAIRASEFESGVDNFVEAVLARLASEHVNEVDLAALWKEIGDERRNPDLAGWRKLEAMMGLDPDEAPDDLMEALRIKACAWGTGAIEEIAASSKTTAVSDLDLILEARKRSVPVHVANIENVRQQIDGVVDHSMYPWQRAAEAARVAREVWSIGRGPISTAILADLFDVPTRYVEQPDEGAALPLAAAFRSDTDAALVSVLLRKRHPAGRRFALARLIGDHLNAGQAERILPSTETKTDRQKFQRAFSQEFLCPIADLTEFMGQETDEPTDDTIEDAAYYFCVSPLLVKTTLVNKGLLSRNALDGSIT